MSDLSSVDVGELRSRMESVLSRLDELFKTAGPLIKEIGNLRVEAGLIYKEFEKRGVLKPEKIEKNVTESTVSGKVSEP